MVRLPLSLAGLPMVAVTWFVTDMILCLLLRPRTGSVFVLSRVLRAKRGRLLVKVIMKLEHFK
jgi:hypothetical protein